MAAIPSQQIVVGTGVLFHELFDDRGDLLFGQHGVGETKGFPKVVVRVHLRLLALDPWHSSEFISMSERPLSAIELDTCMEDPSKFQWGEPVSEHFIQPLDASTL